MRYAKKPVTVDAIQWTGENIGEVELFIAGSDKGVVQYIDGTLKLMFMNGYMSAHPGDYIIRTHKGEVYPCQEDNFNEIYVKLSDEK